MELHLSAELQAKVERAAAENKSGAEEYVKQLVEHYVDHDAWFRQQVAGGRASIPKTVFGWRTLWHLVFQRVRSLTKARRLRDA